MLNTVWARGDQLDWLGTAEALAAVFVDADLDSFARQYVADKNDSPFMTCNKDAAVSDLFDVDLKAAADP
mgnify:CR=1 FL=1